MSYQKLELWTNSWESLPDDILMPFAAALVNTGHFTFLEYEPMLLSIKLQHISGRIFYFWGKNWCNIYFAYPCIRNIADNGNLVSLGELWTGSPPAGCGISPVLIWSPKMIIIIFGDNYFCFCKDTIGRWYCYTFYHWDRFIFTPDSDVMHLALKTYGVQEKTHTEQLIITPALILDQPTNKVIGEMSNIFYCATQSTDFGVYQGLDGSYNWYDRNLLFRGV